ncbi:unnamed protein product [Boreogadus saida]
MKKRLRTRAMEHTPTLSSVHREASATVSPPPQLEESTAPVQKKVFVGALPRWFLIRGEPSPRFSWLRPSLCSSAREASISGGGVGVNRTRSTESFHLVQQSPQPADDGASCSSRAMAHHWVVS